MPKRTAIALALVAWSIGILIKFIFLPKANYLLLLSPVVICIAAWLILARKPIGYYVGTLFFLFPVYQLAMLILSDTTRGDVVWLVAKAGGLLSVFFLFILGVDVISKIVGRPVPPDSHMDWWELLYSPWLILGLAYSVFSSSSYMAKASVACAAILALIAPVYVGVSLYQATRSKDRPAESLVIVAKLNVTLWYLTYISAFAILLYMAMGLVVGLASQGAGQ